LAYAERTGMRGMTSERDSQCCDNFERGRLRLAYGSPEAAYKISVSLGVCAARYEHRMVRHGFLYIAYG
jgi:hypothetical protein